MFDIESKVFDTVAKAVNAVYADAVCYSEYVEAPASFPCVTLTEDDNYTLDAYEDNELTEHYARVTYTANVYCCDDDKKSTAKSIADIIDASMQSMKFTRTMRSQMPNLDRTIYRLTLRYEAVVGRPHTDSAGTVVYPMYRRG